MVRVKINGEQEITDFGSINTMADLVEFVKSHIDPDSIIVDMRLAGRELSDADWRVPLSVQGDALLEVTTGSKEAYVEERLAQAGVYLEQITEQLSSSVENYRSSNIDDANTAFSQSMEDLKAFFGWYGSVLAILAEKSEENANEFSKQLAPIQSACEEIMQLQLGQSWSELANSIDARLNPELRSLKGFCDRLASELNP